MSFIQAKEIITLSRREHLKMADIVSELGDVLLSPRSRSLAEHVQKQQYEMANYLKDYLESSGPGVLNAWFQNMPETKSPLSVLSDLDPAIIPQDLQTVFHKAYAFFSQRYLLVAQLSESIQVREMFSQIAHLGVHESEQFQWQAMEYNDI